MRDEILDLTLEGSIAGCTISFAKKVDISLNRSRLLVRSNEVFGRNGSVTMLKRWKTVVNEVWKKEVSEWEYSIFMVAIHLCSSDDKDLLNTHTILAATVPNPCWIKSPALLWQICDLRQRTRWYRWRIPEYRPARSMILSFIKEITQNTFSFLSENFVDVGFINMKDIAGGLSLTSVPILGFSASAQTREIVSLLWHVY